MVVALKDKFVQKALLEQQSQSHFVAQMEDGEKASVLELESVTADIGNEAVHAQVPALMENRAGNIRLLE